MRLMLNQITTQELDLSGARRKSRAATLILYVNELRGLTSRATTLKNEIDTIRDRYETIKYKRSRLMQQNFSSAPHLRKTHEKYWVQMQDHKSQLLEKQSQLRDYLHEINELKRKIPVVGKAVKNLN